MCLPCPALCALNCSGSPAPISILFHTRKLRRGSGVLWGGSLEVPGMRALEENWVLGQGTNSLPSTTAADGITVPTSVGNMEEGEISRSC